ncbi:hypothetical protein HY571_00850 [Candidatus Micrarchaeota archaeon]|nr:hypothetical protein [Candidatus Micrarchaeota archaeon]
MLLLQAENGTAGFYGIVGTFLLLLIIVSIILQLWSLYIIWKDSRSQRWKAKWGAIVAIFGILGVAAFHFIGTGEKEARINQGKIIVSAEQTEKKIKTEKEEKIKSI